MGAILEWVGHPFKGAPLGALAEAAPPPRRLLEAPARGAESESDTRPAAWSCAASPRSPGARSPR